MESGLTFPGSARGRGLRLRDLPARGVRAGLVRARGLVIERDRARARLAAAGVVAVSTLLVAALHEHDPYDVQAGVVIRAVAGAVPLIAATLGAVTVMRPKLGLVAMLLLMPILDVAQIHWEIGPLQIIDQTLFVAALWTGLLLRDPAPGGTGIRVGGPLPIASWTGLRARLTLSGVALSAVVAMLCLATLSTLVSPQIATSFTVLMHGILEPFLIAAALLLLRPSRLDLVRVMVVLAISVSIGGLLNMLQSIPAMKTLAVMQADRLLFSRVTYFNIGLFGEMLSLTLPLLLALLLAHRNGYLRLGRPVLVILIAALPIDLASLFLSFTKSAYLASAGGSLVLLLLFVESWRRRAAIVAIVVMVSAVVIPWPALVLQVAPSLDQAYRNAMIAIVGESRFDSWNPATSSGHGSLVERFYATEAGIEMAINHPLLGISLDQFETQYLDHYKPAQAKLDLDWAHSMLPEVAAELGLPALGLDLIVYAAALLAAWRVYRAPPDPLARLMAAALIAAMVSWQMMGTAFAGDMYRPWRTMASDYVVMMILIAATFTLYRLARGGRIGGAVPVEI